MRISDWGSDVFSSDLFLQRGRRGPQLHLEAGRTRAAERVPLLRRIGHGIPGHGFPRRHGRRRADLDAERPADRRLAREDARPTAGRSEEHTFEIKSLMSISYAVFCVKQTKTKVKDTKHNQLQ